ncbi:MAG: hypothetical protein AAFO82_13820, partial [Bacteroidota bacterium]
YTLTGTGQFYKATSGFEGRSSYYRPRIYFYKEVNGELVSAGLYSNGYIYLEEDITYYVDVVSDDYENLFWLKLNCAPKVPRDFCDEAETIDLPQGLLFYSRSLSYGRVDNRASCSSANYADTWFRIDGDNRYFDIKLTEDSYYSFRYSMYKGSCDSLVCIASRQSAYSLTKVYFEEGEEYYIQVYSTSHTWPDPSNFKLSFRELPTAPNDLCTGATMLEDGIEITDSLDHAAPNDPTCSERSSNLGLWYQLEGDGKYYTFDISLKYNSNTYIYQPSRSNITLFEGGCDELTCIDNQSMISNRELTFFAEKGKSYFLNYHHLVHYNITINVSSSERIDNDNINDAILVTCDSSYTGYTHSNTYQSYDNTCDNISNEEDIWFKIIGNDEYVDFNSSSVEGIYIFEGATLSCFKKGGTDDILLETGKEYYVRYITNNNLEQYNLTVKCYPVVTNSNCSTAIELSCGDEHIVNTLYAETVGARNRICNDYLNPNVRAVWYKITGDDTWKKLSTEDASFKLYGGSCNEFICLDNTNIFFAEAGKDYYFRVYRTYGYSGTIKLSMSCGETPANNFCEQAEIVSCGDTIQASLDFADGCENMENCNTIYSSINRKKNVWYSITGTGEMIDLAITENSSSHAR